MPTCPSIVPVDPASEAHRRAAFDLLAPRAGHNLFILGNLLNPVPDTTFYAATLGGRWAALAMYCAPFRSLIPSTVHGAAGGEDEVAVIRDLVLYVAARHSPVEALNGIAAVANPALDALATLGYRVTNADSQQVFMELALPSPDVLPPQTHEARARPVAPDDLPRVAFLIRQFRDAANTGPVTDDEVRRASLTAVRYVLEDAEGGQVVSTAATNGVAAGTFQVLGVVTDPAHRGRGYAAAITARLCRDLARQGARRAVLFTNHANAVARRCYERLGFQVTGHYRVARVVQQDPPPATRESP